MIGVQDSWYDRHHLGVLQDFMPILKEKLQYTQVDNNRPFGGPGYVTYPPLD